MAEWEDDTTAEEGQTRPFTPARRVASPKDAAEGVSDALRAGFVEAIEQRYPVSVLETLLKDRTTGRNIIWADDEYEALGEGYARDDEITVERISGLNSGVIKPRIAKERERQSQRTRNRAEVFTPSWLCNQMNNHLDAEWFGREGVFNAEAETLEASETPGSAGMPGSGRGWVPSGEAVEFPKAKGRGWQAYVKSPRLEITCGEAPFICSRYDTVTGEALPVNARIGFLDRKLRVVAEKAKTYKAWIRWALAALKSTYGYEYQGDNLVVARINVLETFVEHACARWGKVPSLDEVKEAALVVSWNLWQMDGLACTPPTDKAIPIEQQTLPLVGEPEPEAFQLALFDIQDIAPEPDGREPDDPEPEGPEATIPLCVIYDWDEDTPKTYASLRDERMQPMKKFYAVIGNPPYQEPTEGTSDKPIYNCFMDEAFKIGERAELITPARFLFNAGKTPKEWNRKMLADPDLKVLKYQQVSDAVFPSTDIKGGVSVTYHELGRNFGPIEVFSAFEELRSIQKKIAPHLSQGALPDLMYPQNRFDLDVLYADYPEAKRAISSNGKERRIVTSSFNKLSVFSDNKQSAEDVRILGLTAGNNRTYRWINRKYIEDNGCLYSYKVILPMANGSGAIGEVLSTPLIGEPLIGEPLIGFTQTFLAIGSTENHSEAEAILKYVKSRFARTLLGILKITQHNTPEKWRYVPLQDFTSASDIDWSQSVADIDRQLYAKYGLSPEEIEFIETHVKEMG